MANSQPNIIIALLDKEFLPSHSFVDGMLAKVVAAQDDISVRLVVSKGEQDTPMRYYRASCIPALFRRRGLGRFLNLFPAMAAIRRGVRDAKRKSARLVVFVRNDPVLLFAAALMRQQYGRLIFQSSYPHEQGPWWSIKHIFAKALYQMSARRVDAITAVSPLGLRRTQRRFPQVRTGEVIPLLADLPTPVAPQKRSSDVIRFIYIGAHTAKRQLHVVVRAAVEACAQCAHIEFFFVGGTPDEITEIQAQAGLDTSHDRITFRGKVPRSEIPQLLANADIGLSLIPPLDEYTEASPTKLGEYMAAGLTVIASKGIPLQEQYVEQSEGGLLVEWHPDKIKEAILRLAANRTLITQLQRNARTYAVSSLQYEQYMDRFERLLSS